MKIFFDTEFLDCLDVAYLLSLGAVREDGKIFYAENADAPKHLATPWIIENVFPKFTGPEVSEGLLRDSFHEFCTRDSDSEPEFWAYVGTFDWWLVMRLYGGFMQLPPDFPHYYHDIKTLATLVGATDRSAWPQMSDPNNIHNALQDAQWNKQVYEFLDAKLKHKDIKLAHMSDVYAALDVKWGGDIFGRIRQLTAQE